MITVYSNHSKVPHYAINLCFSLERAIAWSDYQALLLFAFHFDIKIDIAYEDWREFGNFFYGFDGGPVEWMAKQVLKKGRVKFNSIFVRLSY